MTYDDISQLPPKYQEQIRRKMMQTPSSVAAQPRRLPQGEGNDREQRKYRNQDMIVDGIRFDSRKEARRFLALREMQRCGEISDLKLQVNFTLQEGYTTPEGVRIRPIVYRADFTYYRREDSDTIYIVEDTKSRATKTRVYEIKKKLMREKFGLEIHEV